MNAPRTLDIPLAGETVTLDGDRALIVRDRVLVADVHLDKAASFQRAGMAVPLGDEQDDLDRLAAIAARHGLTRIVVLGDLVHAPPRRGGRTEEIVVEWCRSHPALELSVVLGNHDRDAAERLAHWPLRWITDPDACRLGPFALRHAPTGACESADDGFQLAGHLHPTLRIGARRADRLTLPVFWRRREALILPAFGRFTGGHRIDPAREDAVWGIHEGSILALPGHGSGAGGARR